MSMQGFDILFGTFILKSPVLPLQCKSLSTTEMFNDKIEVTPLKASPLVIHILQNCHCN